MYETSDFKKGLRIEIDGQPYKIVDFQFVKPGKGNAFTRCKIKNLITGNTIDRTLKSGEKVEKAAVEDRTLQFLYEENGKFHFMDNQSYEQYELEKDQIADGWKWLVENMEVGICFYNGAPIDITFPNFTILEITYCEPGIKGDTATNTTKPATLSTGAEVQVPLFVNQGDKIKIDTRTGDYVERANK